jgi:FKBP-type peptidyl-prolyl cis-trans isomerase SlpA
LEAVIGEGVRVTLHFTLSLESGDVVDTTLNGEPASFVYGDEKLPGGFQSYLDGMKSGDKGSWAVPPEKSFGMRNPSNQQSIKRTAFAPDMELLEGLVVSFADAGQSELPGIIRSFDDDWVTVDFNHPLAGQTLRFAVEIINVEAVDKSN